MQTRRNNGPSNHTAGNPPKCDTCGKPPKIHDPNVTTHKNVKWTPLPHSQRTTQKMNQKLITPHLRFVETVDARAYSPQEPPTTYTNDTTVECSGTPSEAWLRQQAIASMKRHPPQENQKATLPNDQDYRNDYRHHEKPPPQPIITTKEPAAQTQRNPVENVHDVHTSSQMYEENTHDSTRSPIFHENFPTFLNSIKEYVTEKDGNTYIPLHSTIVLKNRRRILYLPLEFGELTMDGLVDSGAFINAMSWSDYNAIKMNSDNCAIKEYPKPPFKIECANAQLDQPIATADIQFNIGTYMFTDTFVILSKTSFPIIGLNFMRNHQAVIDTANGTITFPHVEMTLAMTDEKKTCNPKPLQIIAEGHQTLPPQQTQPLMQ